MNHQADNLFATIESAREYISLLAEVVNDVKHDLRIEVGDAKNAQFPRKLDAIRLATYNLDKLLFHLNASRRILNGLRSIQRLLFEERLTTLTAQALSDGANNQGGAPGNL